MRRAIAVTALSIAALSLAPSFAHVLEAPPRLTEWTPELWRETTVFNGQFFFFAVLGAPLDVGVIVVTALWAYLNRGVRGLFRTASAATVFFALALASWFALVAPVNEVLATWVPGPIPSDFSALRTRWETGHMVVCALKFLGFLTLAFNVASRHDRGAIN